MAGDYHIVWSVVAWRIREVKMKITTYKWLHLLISAILLVILAVNLSWVAAVAIVFALGDGKIKQYIPKYFQKLPNSRIAIIKYAADTPGI